MDSLDQPYDEFVADLEKMKDLAKLLEQVRAVGAASDTPPSTRLVDAAVDLREAVRRQSADIPLVSGALHLYLAGRFEYFVRALFESLSEEVADKCSSFSQLPKKMQTELTRSTGEAMRSPSRFGFDEVDVKGFVGNLSRNLSATGGLGDINARCLSVTESNMRPNMLADLFKRVGLESLWDSLGKQSGLKVYFATDDEKQATQEAKAKLEQFMTDRNGIAHPSGSTSFPDPQRLVSLTEFLSVLGIELRNISRVHLTAFSP